MTENDRALAELDLIRRQLIAAVDAHDIGTIIDINQDHPDLLDDVSLLWRALFPPKGSRIDETFVQMLLQLKHPTKINEHTGEKEYTLNVAHNHQGLLASQYLELNRNYSYSSAGLAAELRRLERTHQGTIALRPHGTDETAATGFVSEVIIKLYRRYGAEAYSKEAKTNTKNAIQEMISEFAKKHRREASLAGNALERIFGSHYSTVFCYDLGERQSVSLRILDSLCLVWYAMHDQDQAVLVANRDKLAAPAEGEGDTLEYLSEEEVEDRESDLFWGLFENETAWGGNPACPLGTRERTTTPLYHKHADAVPTLKDETAPQAQPESSGNPPTTDMGSSTGATSTVPTANPEELSAHITWYVGDQLGKLAADRTQHNLFWAVVRLQQKSTPNDAAQAWIDDLPNQKAETTTEVETEAEAEAELETKEVKVDVDVDEGDLIIGLRKRNASDAYINEQLPTYIEYAPLTGLAPMRDFNFYIALLKKVEPDNSIHFIGKAYAGHFGNLTQTNTRLHTEAKKRYSAKFRALCETHETLPLVAYLQAQPNDVTASLIDSLMLLERRKSDDASGTIGILLLTEIGEALAELAQAPQRLTALIDPSVLKLQPVYQLVGERIFQDCPEGLEYLTAWFNARHLPADIKALIIATAFEEGAITENNVDFTKLRNVCAWHALRSGYTHGFEFARCDLSNRDMRCSNLADLDLSTCILSGANLRGITFSKLTRFPEEPEKTRNCLWSINAAKYALSTDNGVFFKIACLPTLRDVAQGMDWLHHACKGGKMQVLEELLGYDATQNYILSAATEDKYGDNALHVAIRARRLNVAKILIEHNSALLPVQNNAGQHPLELLKENKFLDAETLELCEIYYEESADKDDVILRLMGHVSAAILQPLLTKHFESGVNQDFGQRYTLLHQAATDSSSIPENLKCLLDQFDKSDYEKILVRAVAAGLIPLARQILQRDPILLEKEFDRLAKNTNDSNTQNSPYFKIIVNLIVEGTNGDLLKKCVQFAIQAGNKSIYAHLTRNDEALQQIPFPADIFVRAVKDRNVHLAEFVYVHRPALVARGIATLLSPQVRQQANLAPGDLRPFCNLALRLNVNQQLELSPFLHLAIEIDLPRVYKFLIVHYPSLATKQVGGETAFTRALGCGNEYAMDFMHQNLTAKQLLTKNQRGQSPWVLVYQAKDLNPVLRKKLIEKLRPPWQQALIRAKNDTTKFLFRPCWNFTVTTLDRIKWFLQWCWQTMTAILLFPFKYLQTQLKLKQLTAPERHLVASVVRQIYRFFQIQLQYLSWAPLLGFIPHLIDRILSYGINTLFAKHDGKWAPSKTMMRRYTKLDTFLALPGYTLIIAGVVGAIALPLLIHFGILTLGSMMLFSLSGTLGIAVCTAALCVPAVLIGLSLRFAAFTVYERGEYQFLGLRIIRDTFKLNKARGLLYIAGALVCLAVLPTLYFTGVFVLPWAGPVGIVILGVASLAAYILAVKCFDKFIVPFVASRILPGIYFVARYIASLVALSVKFALKKMIGEDWQQNIAQFTAPERLVVSTSIRWTHSVISTVLSWLQWIPLLGAVPRFFNHQLTRLVETLFAKHKGMVAPSEQTLRSYTRRHSLMAIPGTALIIASIAGAITLPLLIHFGILTLGSMMLFSLTGVAGIAACTAALCVPAFILGITLRFAAFTIRGYSANDYIGLKYLINTFKLNRPVIVLYALGALAAAVIPALYFTGVLALPWAAPVGIAMLALAALIVYIPAARIFNQATVYLAKGLLMLCSWIAFAIVEFKQGSQKADKLWTRECQKASQRTSSTCSTLGKLMKAGTWTAAKVTGESYENVITVFKSPRQTLQEQGWIKKEETSSLSI